MSQTVDYYDNETYDKRTSTREYEPIGEVVTEVPIGDYYRGYEKKVTDLWLDPRTGVVVGDIAAYEAWVSK